MVILISWVFHTPVGGEKGYKIIISLKYMEILVLDLLVCIKEIKLMNKNETQSITFEKLRNQKFWLGSFSWAAGLGWGFHTPPEHTEQTEHRNKLKIRNRRNILYLPEHTKIRNRNK